MHSEFRRRAHRRRAWVALLLAALCLPGCYDGDPTDLHDAVVVGRDQVTGLSLSGNGSILELGSALQLVATGTTPAGTVNLSREVSWHSSNPAAMTVNDYGRVTAHANGTATITATLAQFSASANLVASDAALVSIDVSGDATVDECGTGSYSATGLYDDSSSRDISALVTWAVTDGTVARVNASGRLVSKLAGSTGVIASRNGIDSAPFAVTVSDNLVAFEVKPDAPAQINAGDTIRFTATGNRGGADVVITAATTWTFTNDDAGIDAVATVRNGDVDPGLLTAQRGGTGTLTGTCGGLSDTAPVTVTYLDTLSITNVQPVKMTINSTLLLGLQGTYSDGSTRSLNENAVWTVIPLTGTPVTVSNIAGNRGQVTAGTDVGQSTVRATVEGKFYDIPITVE